MGHQTNTPSADELMEKFAATQSIKPEFPRARRVRLRYENLRDFLGNKFKKWPEHKRLQFMQTLLNESLNFQFSPVFVLSVIAVESAFDAKVCSHKAACGLMQIQEPTAKPIARRLLLKWHNGRVIQNPHHNVKIGLAYMAELREQFGHPRLYLSAYNWGPARLRYMVDHGEVVPAKYYLKVREKFYEYQQELANQYDNRIAFRRN